MRTIFYDMDNTLALFSIKGEEGESLEKMFEKGFFRNLPVLGNAVIALKVLINAGFDVRILSACVDSPYCKEEKKEWLKEHFSFIEDSKIHLMEVGQNKAEIIKSQGLTVNGSYLVDDYSKNLEQWAEYGGIPIKKRFSNKNGWENVVRNHLDIFEILF